MKRRVIFGFTALAVLFIAGVIAAQSPLEWTLVNWKVRHDFPRVSRIPPEEVMHRLSDAKRKPPVLLDVRTQAEFDISHIHGARRIEPGASTTALDLPLDTPIVTYCSVGYRSGAFAEELRKAGYANVRNMSGSIFQWANEGYPLERSGSRVNKVHPYNAIWGKLLKPELRAAVPPVVPAHNRAERRYNIAVPSP